MKPSLFFYCLMSLILGSFVNCQSPKQDQNETISTDTSPLPEVEKPDRIWNVGFVTIDGVFNSELIAPFDILHHTVFHTEYGMKVFVVSPTEETITTYEGIRIIPDFSFDSDSLPEFDVLIVPSAVNNLDTDLEK